jgi:hypothetical protein
MKTKFKAFLLLIILIWPVFPAGSKDATGDRKAVIQKNIKLNLPRPYPSPVKFIFTPLPGPSPTQDYSLLEIE